MGHTLITITSVPTQFSTSTHNHDEVQHSRFRCYAPRSTSPLSSHRHQIRSAQGRMGKCRLSKGTGENLEHYPAPPGGWENVDYPKGTGENLEHYPPPPGGWENVDYPKGTGENLEHCPPPPKGDDDEKDDEPEFTSRYHITAVGAEVRNGTVSVQV